MSLLTKPTWSIQFFPRSRFLICKPVISLVLISEKNIKDNFLFNEIRFLHPMKHSYVQLKHLKKNQQRQNKGNFILVSKNPIFYPTSASALIFSQAATIFFEIYANAFSYNMEFVGSMAESVKASFLRRP